MLYLVYHFNSQSFSRVYFKNHCFMYILLSHLDDNLGTFPHPFTLLIFFTFFFKFAIIRIASNVC